MSGREGRAQEALERLKELPGGPQLLALAGERDEEVELVGGAVRDILLGRRPRELDVVVGGDANAFAQALAERVRFDGTAVTELTQHERFNTAVVRWQETQVDVAARPHEAQKDVATRRHEARVDIATRRHEAYPEPGALPQVTPGSPEQDLARRDFTVNAIALSLAGERRLRAAPLALEDLDERRLRVLHDASFRDDPTRILRLARYGTRLGFQVDPHTAALAQQAIAEGALHTLAGARLGAELRLALDEEESVAALAELERMGVLAAWESGVRFDEHVVRTALGILPGDGDPRLLLCAALVVDLMSRIADDEETEGAVLGFLHDIELPSGQAQRAFSAGIIANCAARWLDGSETTGEMLELMDGAAIEGLALAAAMSDKEEGPGSYARRAIEDWLYEHRHIRLHITGDDLLAAGLPEGPEIGRRLERVFAMRMTGMLDEGREGELSAALADD
jgi:tRNA nucleotidyltransferase (CCA-adding enzyme)